MTTRRNLLRAAAGIVAIGRAIAPARAKDWKILRIATDGSYPPWNSIDGTGRPVGFDMDVGSELCRRAGLEPQFALQDWDGIIPGLQVGKYDAIMGALSITERRRQVIAFSKPYAATSNSFASFADMPPIVGPSRIDLTTIDDSGRTAIADLGEKLKGKSVGVQRSTNAELFVNEHLGKTVVVRSYDTQDNLNLDLAAGRIDAGLADFSTWKSFMQRPEGGRLKMFGPAISGGLFGPGIGIGLRKSDADLAALLDKAIESARGDGTLSRLSQKWFGADLTAPS